MYHRTPIQRDVSLVTQYFFYFNLEDRALEVTLCRSTLHQMCRIKAKNETSLCWRKGLSSVFLSLKTLLFGVFMVQGYISSSENIFVIFFSPATEELLPSHPWVKSFEWSVVSPYVPFENVLPFSTTVAMVTCWVVFPCGQNFFEEAKNLCFT
jgi:hypothetical protein